MKLNNKYYILRYGEAESNVKQIVSCWPEKINNPLTKKGVEQIGGVSERLKNKNIDLIFSSPILRAKQTAGLVGKVLGIEPQLDLRLKEIDFGPFNGASVSEFEKYFGSLEVNNLKKRIKSKAPGGENYEEVMKRMFDCFKEINKKYKGKNVLIVSHHAPLLLLWVKVLGHSLSESIEHLEKIFQEKRITKGELIELN